jgi:succinyl-CoA synthetase alpha subunit
MGETAFRIFPNLYKDSVALMQLAQTLREREGVAQASCLMATPANLEQLTHAELTVRATVAPSDLLVVVRGEPAACEAALDAADALLRAADRPSAGTASAFDAPLTSLALGVEQAEAADLALISVPGDYAAAEAMKALALGLHVMLFSDNVPLDEECAIKAFARDKGLLVMGPDCGTAIVNGVPLGFANVVRRGDIGLVAASGTGLQEVTCRIHHLGRGVSQALGTGGRDLKLEVGGITMLQGLQMLAADERTRVIVLISKPPAPEIARQIERTASQSGKPVVVHFLGASPEQPGSGNLMAAHSLRHAADTAVALAAGRPTPVPAPQPSAEATAMAERWLAGMTPAQRHVRALFTGGTFCYEAQLALLASGLPCRSNAPAPGALPFEGRFDGHVLLDLGEDEYTRGRPHPMIDPSLRDAAVREAGADATVAAILFDVVLGYGAHPDPAGSLALALAQARRDAQAQGRTLALIGHVCGTDRDPQDKSAQVRALQSAGALVVDSNIEAALLAAHVARRRAERPA